MIYPLLLLLFAVGGQAGTNPRRGDDDNRPDEIPRIPSGSPQTPRQGGGGEGKPPTTPGGRLPPIRPPPPNQDLDNEMDWEATHPGGDDEEGDDDSSSMDIDSEHPDKKKRDPAAFDPQGVPNYPRPRPSAGPRGGYRAFPSGSANAGWYFLAVFLALALVILLVVTLLVRSMAERRRREWDIKREAALKAEATAEALKERRTSVIVIREPPAMTPSELEEALPVPRSKRRKASVEAVDLSKLDF